MALVQVEQAEQPLQLFQQQKLSQHHVNEEGRILREGNEVYAREYDK